MRSFVVLCVIVSLTQAVKIIKTCPGKPADIVFVVDESNSIYIKDFEKQLLFVRNVTNAFTIAPDKVRIGLITWNTVARTRWRLNTYTEKDQLLQQISGVGRKIGGRTYTHMALAKAREMLREQQRPNVPRIVILMTDGASSTAELTALEASRLHKANVTVFAIGIGKVNMQEINMIATDPDSSHAYIAKNFAELGDKLKNQLVASTCEIQEIRQPGECGPEDKVDLAFVMGSYNQNPVGAHKAMELVKNIVDNSKIIVGPNNVQVAMVPTDCVPIGFNLNAYSNKPSLLFHFEFAGKRFDATADLLDVMRDQTFVEENGARKDARKVAVVILDKASPDKEATIRAAKAAAAKGIKVVCVGVGDDVNTEELAQVASSPDMSFRVKDYNELWTLRDDIIWKLACPNSATPL